MKNTALVVDGLNLLHRGHFAVGELTNADGLPTGAIRGFINILLADIKLVEATHVAVVFDRPGKNFRHKLYPAYKANRDSSTEESQDIRQAIIPTRNLLNAMGIRVFGKRGIEGDDTIGSIAHQASKHMMTYISSNDKDFASLVTDKLHLLRPKGEILDVDGVFEKYGVEPEQMIDYLMMLGDKVDNIPGINKVGHKTAAKWLLEHGTLKAVCRNEKFTAKMQKNIDAARPLFNVTRKLVTIDLKAASVNVESLALSGLKPELSRLCNELDFRSTYKSILNTLK